MRIAVVDTETTGVDPATAKVVEMAVVFAEDQGHLVGPTFSSLVNPGVPIPPEASAVHHLVDADVRMQPSIEDVVAKSGIQDCDLLVAHNATYDSAVLANPLALLTDAPWLCTWRASLHVYPDAPSHKNQVLRYWLGLDIAMSSDWIPHRALPDAWVTAHLLMRMLEDGHTIDDLMVLAPQPALLRRVGFGKHFGTPWSDVPVDYLSWVVRQDFDADVMHTARHWLRGGR